MCKKDRGLDFCIDFCNLNARTKKDSYPVPQIHEAIESLVATGCFSCLDLKVGFWQIAMDEASKQYTAFTLGNLGFFEYECPAFGLCNAPATFQRLMLNCLGELNLTYCLIYLDDEIVFSKTEEEHLEYLHVVFNYFQEHNFRLKPTKCKFFWDEINYLAHHVSREGVWPSKENLKAVAEFAPPQTYIKIKAFLGLVRHLGNSSRSFYIFAQWLHEHLLGEGACKKSKWVIVMAEAKGALKTL